MRYLFKRCLLRKFAYRIASVQQLALIDRMTSPKIRWLGDWNAAVLKDALEIGDYGSRRTGK